MRIWALIILVLSCLVGFMASYGIVYNTVATSLHTTSYEVPSSSSFASGN